MVKCVEEIGPELEGAPLRDLKRLEDGAVELRLPVGEQGIGSRVAVSLLLQVIHEGGGIVPTAQCSLTGRQIAVFDAVRTIALPVVQPAHRRRDAETGSAS